ncbi:MAG: GWxTD domain-containing protein [Candidatus Aminicenantes bacterium]
MKKNSPDDLPPRHRKWLSQDVAYIITSKEKDVFLQLSTDKERDMFIQAFWKQRDPVPETPENEFKEEHYRRIAHANEYFGRETTRPGWQTDRGRIYIVLGPPVDVGRYEGGGYVFPSRIWSYEANPEYGLYSRFNLIFFKRKGIGEYILYSPARDGPAGLLINYQGDPSNTQAAYQQLRKFDARLAETSISLIPGEPSSFGRPSLASEMLIDRIYSVPQKTVDSQYAEALLKYKDIVEVEYTANFITSRCLVRVIREDSGIFFVHYAIQPEELSVLSYGEGYRIDFSLNGMVTDLNGKVIFQYQKTIPLRFNEHQIEDIQKTAMVIQDAIPLVPGDYKFSLLLKNTVSKEFASAEKNISIPQNLSSVWMNSLLLGYRSKAQDSLHQASKPFKIGDFQIACQPSHVFHSTEELIVFFQIHGLSQEIQKKGWVKYIIYRNGEEFLSKEKNIKEFTYPHILEKFPLQDFPPDYYEIKVTIMDHKKREIISDRKEFEISASADLPRPWIVSKVMPVSGNIEYSFILGSQWERKGSIQEAQRLLERVYHEKPTSLRYALSYAQLLFKRKEYRKVKEILVPFVETSGPDFRFLSLLGASCQALGEYEQAVSYYKQYLSHEGTHLEVLNSIGACYFHLGNEKEALRAWEKSLEIDPHQKAVKKRVDQLKKK